MIVKIVNQSSYPLPKYATALSAGMDLNANIESPIALTNTLSIHAGHWPQSTASPWPTLQAP